MADDEKKKTPEAEEPEAPAKTKEGKKGKEAKEKKEATPKPKKGDYGPDFKYIVRLANTDLDGTKTVQIALTSVKGIGNRVGRILATTAGVKPSELIGNLSDADIEKLSATIGRAAEILPGWAVNRPFDVESGADLHLVAADVDTFLRDDLNRMKKIRSYKGVRHEAGLPVRGQRTRANGRTGLTVGVQRQKAQAAAAAAGAKEEAK